MAIGPARINQFGFKPKRKPGGIRSVYDAATTKQAGDYDEIMGNYRSIYNNARDSNANATSQSGSGGGNPLSANYTSYVPASQYVRGGDLNTQIKQLQGMSETGGYSNADIGNIRERGISPIRSIYANAQRDLGRQKVLSGGYSPNAGALTAKLARESSSRIGDLTTKVNADIAQMIQSGKFNASQLLAPLLAKEDEIKNATSRRNDELKYDVESRNAAEKSRVEQYNSEMMRQIDEIRRQNAQQGTNNQLNATQGMQSLYGTTPALSQLFGNQVLQNNQQNMQANTTANQLKNQRANIGLNLVNNQLGQRVGSR